MTAYTTNFAGNVQIGTGDNINPPDEGNVLVQQSISQTPSAVAIAANTFFRLPASCRISDVWIDLGPTAVTGGTAQLLYSLDNSIFVSFGGLITFGAGSGNRVQVPVSAGAPFTVSLNTGNNIFWRFDTASVAPVTTVAAQLVIRYHLLTP